MASLFCEAAPESGLQFPLVVEPTILAKYRGSPVIPPKLNIEDPMTTRYIDVAHDRAQEVISGLAQKVHFVEPS